MFLPTLLSHTGPDGQLAAVQGTGPPEAAGWAVACPLENPGPLSQHIHILEHTAQGVTTKRDRATSSSSSPGCHPHHTTLHGGESREEKEENTRVPDSQNASSDSEFLAQNFKHTHIHTHIAPKCFDLLATGNSTEGKKATAKSSEKLF